MSVCETSFHLLSTMSPKLNTPSVNKKHKKSPRKLALKKNFRRSSLFDKKDHSLIIDSSVITVEESILETDSNSDERAQLNNSPIVISDTSDLDSSSDVEQKPKNKAGINIDNWLSENEKENGYSKNYSFGNTFPNFSDDENEIPRKYTTKISTEGDDSDTGFDNKSESQTSKSDEVIDDSFVELDERSEDILDDIYGKIWRNNKLLTMSESKRTKKVYPVNSVQTERKPTKNSSLKIDPMIKKNIFHLPNIQKKQSAQTNWWKERLKSLCDSDTEDSESEQRNKSFSKSPKDNEKDGNIPYNGINFSDSDNDSLHTRVRKKLAKKSKESNMENFKTPEAKVSKYFTDSRSINKKLNESHCDTPSKSSELSKKIFEDIESSDNDSLETRIRKNIFKEKIDTKKGPDLKKLDITPNKRENTKADKVKTSGKNKENNIGTKINTNITATYQNQKYSFLKSLSGCTPLQFCNEEAKFYKTDYKTHKVELAKKLFELFNQKVFENSLPNDTLIEWNTRMTNTAGYCYNKRKTDRFGVTVWTSRIVLAVKILDSADRLRDTLIHEMCHAATWIVNHVSDGHGTYWKSWAYKALKTFPELPPIKRCHDYKINTKYTYKCMDCGYSFGRHSKSLNIEIKRCGYCWGKFEVFINKVTKAGVQQTLPATPKRKANEFALYVKENYNLIKTSDMDHGKVMKVLGQQFSAIRIIQNN